LYGVPKYKIINGVGNGLEDPEQLDILVSAIRNANGKFPSWSSIRVNSDGELYAAGEAQGEKKIVLLDFLISLDFFSWCKVDEILIEKRTESETLNYNDIYLTHFVFSVRYDTKL
jgi:hypothetical protein